MKKPNLFIIGAPKCGTTALAKWLSDRPEIYFSPVKEPHYFSEEYRLTPGIERYEALFETANPAVHKWVGEASVWYLFSTSAVRSILEYSPDARFIVMLRDPLDMAPSMHEQQRFNGNEEVDDFEKALGLSDRRQRGEGVGVWKGYVAPQHLAYLHCCSLGWQVRRLLEVVPSNKVHFVVFDDLSADPANTYSQVLGFLGLSVDGKADFAKVNTAKRRASPLLDKLVLRAAAMKCRLGIGVRFRILSGIRRWNVVHHQRPPLSRELREKMASHFRNDVALLGNLIGRDFSHWAQPGGRE